MNDTDSERQNEAIEVNNEIAAIEAESEKLAQQNEVPQIVSAQREEVRDIKVVSSKVDQAQTLSLSTKKSHFWQKRPNKWVLIALGVLLVVLIALWFIPQTRHYALNVAGVRSSVMVSASQEASENASPNQVKNFSVFLGDSQVASSGSQSEVMVQDVTFGNHTLVVKKNGYADVSQNVIVDFNPLFGLLGTREQPKVTAALKAQGIPFTFMVKDWASQTALKTGSFSVGDLTAQPNDKGVVSLIAPVDTDTVTVSAAFNGEYVSKEFPIVVEADDQEVFFVPTARHYFVSKRSGVFSVYSSYIDNTDIKEVVKGTNQETASIQFAVSPSGKYGVMTSSREGRRDASGNVMQKLYWVNLTSGKLVDLDTAQFFTLHDWSGDTIAYSYSYQDETSGQYRQRLRSLDTTTQNQFELGATSGYFGRVQVALGMVIFTQEEGFGSAGSEKGLTVRTVGVKGENTRELATNTSELRQIGFERFAYLTADKKWNEVNLNTSQIRNTEAPRQEDAIYIANENNNKQRVFVSFVDGQRILTLQENDGKTKQLVTQPGLSGPIRFVGQSTLVYRVITPTETADYAVSILGGSPRKIVDVTASAYANPVFFQYY